MSNRTKIKKWIDPSSCWSKTSLHTKNQVSSSKIVNFNIKWALSKQKCLWLYCFLCKWLIFVHERIVKKTFQHFSIFVKPNIIHLWLHGGFTRELQKTVFKGKSLTTNNYHVLSIHLHYLKSFFWHFMCVWGMRAPCLFTE